MPTALAIITMSAARHLPEGWQVEIRDGVGEAIEVRLKDAAGRRLPGQCRLQHGPIYLAYRRFADAVFREQARLYPVLEGQLAWGGKFTRADNQWRLGHFDLGGWRGRGHYRRPQDREPRRKKPSHERNGFPL